MKKKIAIIGTQGLPNKYGGFETLVEYLTKYLAEEFEITVFCSSKIYPEKIKYYNNAKLRYLPFHANGFQSVAYDSLSLLLSLRYDKVLILGSSGGIIMPFLKPFRNKFILNFGGLDWQRSKWGNFEQTFLKLSEKLAISSSSELIADNQAIQNYISEKYNRNSRVIEYGGDQVLSVVPNTNDYKKYPFLKAPYDFSVARIQPDNNIDMILDSFVGDPSKQVVFVGNWSNSEYGIMTRERYSKYNNILLLDAIYDQRELDLLRSNCTIYLHGHSAGGTNPSLVEAMSLGLPIFAFTSGFNEFTTENKAKYFSSSQDLQHILRNTNLKELKSIGTKMKIIAQNKYKWKIIAQKYSEIFEN